MIRIDDWFALFALAVVLWLIFSTFTDDGDRAHH